MHPSTRDGVRNYQACNFHAARWPLADGAPHLNSNGDPPAIVGELEAVKVAYPDETQFDRKAVTLIRLAHARPPQMVDLKYRRH